MLNEIENIELIDAIESDVKRFLAPLLKRVDKGARQDWIKEIKCLFGSSEHDFAKVRSIRHLSQIAHSCFALRNRIKKKSKSLKKRSYLRLFPATLQYAFGHRKVLAVVFAIMALDEYELLNERHFSRACSSLFPGSRIVPQSYVEIESRQEGSIVYYFEIELSNTFPSRENLLDLSKRLDQRILALIEPLESKLFMPVNEEEVYKNTLLLASQLKRNDDPPQLYLNFVQQTHQWLEFHALIVLVRHKNSSKNISLPKDNPLAKCHLKSCTSLGFIKNTHEKISISLSIEVLKTPLYRRDHSVDFLRARKFIVRLLADHFGTVRDYNGGLLTQTHQQLEKARLRLTHDETVYESILDGLFLHLQPHVAKNLISSTDLITLFRLSLVFALNEKTTKDLLTKWSEEDSTAFAICSSLSIPSPAEFQLALNSFGLHERSLAFSQITVQKTSLHAYILYDITKEQFEVFKTWIEESSRRKSGNYLPSKTIRLSLTRPTKLLDPRIATDRTSGIVIKHLYEGLYRLAPSGVPQPALAYKCEVSPCGLHFRFHIRESFWTNGLPVTAYDFEYSWKKILSPTFETIYSYLFYPIKNAKEVKAGVKPLSDLGVRAVSDHILEVELSQCAPYFIELCCHWVYSPLSKEIDLTHPGWAYYSGSDYVCNGPFKLHSWKKNSHITLVRNDNYWNAASVEPERLDINIIEDPKQAYTLFQERKIDIVGEPLSEIPFQAKTSESRAPLICQDVSALLWFVCNTSRPPFRSKKCRHALSLALNRNEIIDKILGGSEKSAHSLIADSYSRIEKEVIIFDPVKAKHLFTSGLEEQGLRYSDLRPIKIRVYNQEPYKRMSEYAKQAWNEILGIPFVIENVSWDTFFSEIPKRNYDMLALSWYSWYQDSHYTLDNFRTASNAMNVACWEDSYYQELLNKADAATSDELRTELLKHAEAYLMHELPVIPICGHTFRYMKDPRIDRIYISHLGNIDLKWTTFS